MRFVMILLASLAWACKPGAEAQTQSARGFALPEGDAASGRQAFEDLKCFTCHEVAGLEDELPRPTATPVVDVKLGGLAMREPEDGELVSAIINPSHQIYPGGEKERVTSGSGSRMANLNAAMTVQQLIDLVAFLHQRYETVQESER